jgi:hypothetical protein
LHETARELSRSPQEPTSYQVLERAYFRPGGKQAAAAADLGMGYSTFRRHLSRAIGRLAELLWIEAASDR